MPWTAADADRHTSGLDDKQKRQWAHVANSALAQCLADGGERKFCEGKAVRMANGVVGKAAWGYRLQITKLDDDQHLVFGWFSIAADKERRPVVDLQGDVIAPSDLFKTVSDFNQSSRRVSVMHSGQVVGACEQSLVFTPEVQEALGLAVGQLPVGWFGVLKIYDDAVWQQVKSGALGGISVGGTGKRAPYAD